VLPGASASGKAEKDALPWRPPGKAGRPVGLIGGSHPRTVVTEVQAAIPDFFDHLLEAVAEDNA
jgi:hypothetical protein